VLVVFCEPVSSGARLEVHHMSDNHASALSGYRDGQSVVGGESLIELERPRL